MKRVISKEEKIIRLLDYLKQYTDQNNPASIPQIERYFESKGYPHFFGNKNTRKNMIKELARVMNTDIDGNLLPREEWRLVYNDFIKEYEEGQELKSHHIVNIYYKKVFADSEVNGIIASINQNPSLEHEYAEELRKKVKEKLANNNYGKRPMTPAERKAQETAKKKSDAWVNYLMSRKSHDDYY